MGQDVTRQLTEKEQAFVEHFSASGYKSRKESVEAAGYKAKDPSTLAYEILKRPAVQNALATEKEKKRKFLMLDEMDVIEGLHTEATNSKARLSERIQAWVHIGKHYGMFQPLPEKEEDKKGNVTIINYNDPDFKKAQIKEEVEEATAEISPEEAERLAKLVTITDYADNDTV